MNRGYFLEITYDVEGTVQNYFFGVLVISVVVIVYAYEQFTPFKDLNCYNLKDPNHSK